MTKGSIVLSKAGRDKGTLLMVLAVEDNFVILADGRGRKIEQPKRKKLRHVELVGVDETVTNGELTKAGYAQVTNREVRHVLSRFKAVEQEGLGIVSRGSH